MVRGGRGRGSSRAGVPAEAGELQAEQRRHQQGGDPASGHRIPQATSRDATGSATHRRHGIADTREAPREQATAPTGHTPAGPAPDLRLCPGLVTDARLAAIIEDTARRLSAAFPAPRGLPYLGLESPSGTGTHLLDALSAHGIFRKYEQVLDLAGGLGATGRWLAGRLGCSAVVTAELATDAAAGATLTRRARQRPQVHHVDARATALPFRDARFTHAWIVETLPTVPDAPAALAEARRVVRPGGYLAVQDLVSDGGAPVPALRGWRITTREAREHALRGAGFVDLVIRDVADPAERSARLVAARAQLQAQLAAIPALAAVAAERAAVAAALADGRLRVVQLIARRP
jgi:sarcosine/dimethylglycine N-methyltransferase